MTSIGSASTLTLANGRKIGGEHPCLIIAEIGQNHQGSLEIAKLMIKMARDAGADVAKFQKSDLETKFTPRALNRPYNSPHSFGKTYGEHKRHLEFTPEQFQELQRYAEKVGIMFSASGMDVASFEFLDQIGVPFVKVGSGDTNNLPLIEAVAQRSLPMVISTGMNSLENVSRTVETALRYQDRIILLQCTSSYPLPDSEVNLRVMDQYREQFGDRVIVGYSGHESGIGITLAAVARGAKVIERHVTLDKTWKGNDHSASLEPAELKQLCQEIRRIEQALGDGQKKIEPSEQACFQKLGKTTVYRADFPTDYRLQPGDLMAKVDDRAQMSGEGIDPIEIPKYLGQLLIRPVKMNQPLDPVQDLG